MDTQDFEFIDFPILSLCETRIGIRISKINKIMEPIPPQLLLKYRIARINIKFKLAMKTNETEIYILTKPKSVCMDSEVNWGKDVKAEKVIKYRNGDIYLICKKNWSKLVSLKKVC